MDTIFGTIDEHGEIYTDKGGRVICLVCHSTKGVHAKSYLRHDKNGQQYSKLFIRCVNCGSVEIHNNNTGEILEQRIKEP
jgi:RNase P subunit RPR2